jgi:hypothetical protein
MSLMRVIFAAMGSMTLALEVYFIITQLVPLFPQLFIIHRPTIDFVLLYAGYAGVVVAGIGVASLAILFAIAASE